MRVKRLNGNAELPKRSYIGSVGYDLYAAVNITVPPRGTTRVPTGLHIAFPKGYYGQISSRSGMALYDNVFTLAGVIGLLFSLFIITIIFKCCV